MIQRTAYLQLVCPFPGCFSIRGEIRNLQTDRVDRAKLNHLCPTCALKKNTVVQARDVARKGRAQIKASMRGRPNTPTRPTDKDVDFILDNYRGE